jgi:hypothetical protein
MEVAKAIKKEGKREEFYSAEMLLRRGWSQSDKG